MNDDIKTKWAELVCDACYLERILKDIKFARNNMKTPPLKLFGIENYLNEQHEIRLKEIRKLSEELKKKVIE